MPRVVQYSSPAEPQHREPAMARKPEDNDDSEDLPMPNKAEIDRILRGVVPRTPDWVKEKTSQTRGQAYAQYEGSGAPAKAKRDDTLEIAGPVVVDDTNVDGLQLSPLTLQRIEKRRQDAEQRNDSTVSVDTAEPLKRKSIYPIIAFLLIGIVGVVIWVTRSKATTTDAPIPPATSAATSTTAATASSPMNVPPVPTVVESATASATPESTAAVVGTSSAGPKNVKPPHTASASPTVSTATPATHPSASASGHTDFLVNP